MDAYFDLGLSQGYYMDEDTTNNSRFGNTVTIK